MTVSVPRTTPHCTIVVPVHNAVATLERCLEGIAAQCNAPAFEVIVVDDGSTDGTRACALAWQQRNPDLALRLLEQPQEGLAAARNRGAQAAEAPLVLFVDADCVPAPQWVAAFAAAFEDARVVGAKGPLRTEQAGLVPQFVQAEYEDRYDRIRNRAQIDFIDNYSAAYRRDIFLANAGFDVDFEACEDQELSFRLA